MALVRGDNVRLKCTPETGVWMVIIEFCDCSDKNGPKNGVKCEWMDPKSSERREGVWDLISLTKD